jgi:hypothetical protein
MLTIVNCERTADYIYSLLSLAYNQCTQTSDSLIFEFPARFFNCLLSTLTTGGGVLLFSRSPMSPSSSSLPSFVPSSCSSTSALPSPNPDSPTTSHLNSKCRFYDLKSCQQHIQARIVPKFRLQYRDHAAKKSLSISNVGGLI